MAKHVCCITTSLLGVHVDFATQVATHYTAKCYMAEQPSNVYYLTAIRPVLTAEVRQNRPPDLLVTFTHIGTSTFIHSYSCFPAPASRILHLSVKQ